MPQFKKEMAQLVDHAVSNTLSLGKVRTKICTFLVCLICVSVAVLHDNGYHDFFLFTIPALEDIKNTIYNFNHCYYNNTPWFDFHFLCLSCILGAVL